MSRMSRALWATRRFSDGTADALKSGPDVELSTLRYATACSVRSRACCSPHSVDEVNVNSSASQLANTIVRFGRVPRFASAPSDRASSINDAVPLDGSTPPYTHASRWLPTMTSWSGDSVPVRRPVTVQIGRTLSSICTRIWTVAGPAPTRYAIGRPPCHVAGASGPFNASRIGRASLHESGALMIFGRDAASAALMRVAPGTEAHPGVSGSPGTRKSYPMPPRWMWLSGPHGPSG